MISGSFDEGEKSAMTCPKCGFVSFSGLPECKKCGYRFVPKALPSAVVRPGLEPPRQPTPPAAPTSQAGEPADSQPSPPPMMDWQQEVSDRMVGYRRRQARLHGQAQPSQNLDFDFETRQPPPGQPNANILEFPTSGFSAPPLPPINPDADEEGISLGGPTSERDSVEDFVQPADELDQQARPEARPLEIILEAPPSAPGRQPLPASLEGPLAVAGLGKRFVAGIFDALVLLAAMGLFTLIFWRAGGQFSKTPLDLAVGGFIVGFFIFFYFSTFTIFTAATPGLAAMGLEVRADNGGQPNLRDSLWRGVGYLVSLSPLMLGFVWALVDTDSLTWHDRMSGTFVAAAEASHAPVPAHEL